jgi:hypothetical protein
VWDAVHLRLRRRSAAVVPTAARPAPARPSGPRTRSGPLPGLASRLGPSEDPHAVDCPRRPVPDDVPVARDVLSRTATTRSRRSEEPRRLPGRAYVDVGWTVAIRTTSDLGATS